MFPSSQQSRQDILEEPTFHATDCNNDSAPSPSSPPLGEELLVSTEGEQGPCFSDNYDQVMTYLPSFIPAEFDLTSESTNLYYQNIASLKLKHDTLLASKRSFPVYSLTQNRHFMISQLLVKVQELEKANTQIPIPPHGQSQHSPISSPCLSRSKTAIFHSLKWIIKEERRIFTKVLRLRVLFIGLVLITPGKPGSRDGASAGKGRIWYSGSCQCPNPAP